MVGIHLICGLPLCPPIQVRIGGLSRQGLVGALAHAGVRLNASGEALLQHEGLDLQHDVRVQVVHCTVGQLGFIGGASLSSIFGKAQALGLSLCPPATGPYLRLVMTGQKSAPDSILSRGSAPSGSMTVATAPLDSDDDFAKGFYLRVVDGVAWLRGYHASDQHTWSADDCFAFVHGQGAHGI